MKELISSGLEALGLTGSVPPDAAEKLAEYGRLLLEKNQVMNLTAIRDEAGVARLHMLDCAALLPCADFSQAHTLLDVGTGAGFPGLPLKILLPQLDVTLLDSLNKRVDWLNEVSAQLGLTGVRAIQGRAEERALDKSMRDSFDLVTARAVADLRLLAELCLPYVKPGGLFLAMKSNKTDEEIAGAEKIIQALGGEKPFVMDYLVPGTEVYHRVVTVFKARPTPGSYPRKWTKIKETKV